MALHRLRTEAENHSRTLYGNNQMVYGLPRYGTIGTPEKHFLAWKEDEAEDSCFKLDYYHPHLHSPEFRSGLQS
ncbi:MAG: hypothetical protein P8Y27_18470, partial [Chromatiaceae bacterium]